MKKLIIYILTPLLIAFAGCQKEFINPNAADGGEVIQSAEGLTALIVGLKKEFSVGATSALYNAVSANANNNAPRWPGGNPGTYTYSNNLTTAPQFVSATDFHLQTGSALINAGVDVGLPFLGTAPDIGCYEMQ